MKTMDDIRKKIESLKQQKKDLGEYRKSCANLGRGVTDSILEDMEHVQTKIDTLYELLGD